MFNFDHIKRPRNTDLLIRSHHSLRGCIGWWPMLEGGGTVVKNVVGVDDGALAGNSIWLPGAGLQLDGGSDNFGTGANWYTNQLNGLGAASFQIAFIDTESASSNNWIVNSGLGVMSMHFQVNGESATSNTFDASFGGVGWSASNTVQAPANAQDTAREGIVVTVTCDLGTEPLMYINGRLITPSWDKTGNSTINGGGSIPIGGSGTSHQGNLFYFKVWNRQISDAEVWDSYQHPYAAYRRNAFKKYFFPMEAGAAGLSIPVAMNQYRRQHQSVM